ncbi:hypothetical protein CRG98_019102 [Punica granatum]|uniref:Uncharacterized protein n=1 Tax=Punica granatum TaxID=22663 RepID=A0A2I0JVU6_PUNGR|nr:hypothetical protein CRG98_019102 [Punica granatum]
MSAHYDHPSQEGGDEDISDASKEDDYGHPDCAHPYFVSSGHACALLNATRLGSVHLPGDARRTHVRMSRHLPFYDPKVEGRQVTQV